MKKLLLLFVCALAGVPAFAQMGGVAGSVLSRANREPLSGVQVAVEPGTHRATTDREGRFQVDGLDAGAYALTFEALDFEPLTLTVRVDEDQLRAMNPVILAAEAPAVLDDSVFAEFDTESGGDASSVPGTLSASRDVFTSASSYRFSEMRFRTRGYDSQYQDIYLNGIRFNDALTGYGPWSLWSGLNDATRNQNNTTGLQMSDWGLGGVGGVTNINARASQLRQGVNVGLAGGNATYRARVMGTYASGLLDNGWAYAFSVSTRQGGNDYVDGVFYNAYGYFLSAEKILNSRHRVGLTAFGVPTERGAQQASTQEVYDLVGSNYYNPNVGYQSGKMRNSRVRNYHEPVVVANYTFDIDERQQLNVATALRFGKNGYSALSWYGGPDPRPDYYRYLPSYQTLNATDAEAAQNAAAQLADRWERNVGGIRYFDFDEMWQINRDNRDPADQALYGQGLSRSNYIIEERHTDQLDWNLALQYALLARENARLTAGATLRMNKTSYYDQIKDLLGGDYWVDMDKFAERDFGQTGESAYNDLDYYYEHGRARTVGEGDKFGYYYKANVRRANAWANYAMNFGRFDAAVGAEVGGVQMWREGMWRKGLFPNESKGKSGTLEYLTYRAKANLSYAINVNHLVEANVLVMADAPSFQNSFVSPRTRGQFTPGLSSEKTLAADLSYELRLGDLQARVSGFYTQTTDGARVISFYDDMQSAFTNFAMSGIDKQYVGMELGVRVPIWQGLSAEGALSMGQYTYNSDPTFLETVDNSATPITEGRVYWDGMRIESTPQTAATIGLAWRGPNRLFFNLNGSFYDHNYLSMNPLRRTDNVIISGMNEEQVAAMRAQERFDEAFTLSASVGKMWSIAHRYTLGVNLEVRNLLNDQTIRTGGYEQMRLQWEGESRATATSYKPFDSKYFHLFGTTYYLNVYFRF